IFSSNGLPWSEDSTDGFYDRWLIVPLHRRFRGTTEEQPQRVIVDRLTQPLELSGLLNKALMALPDLRQRGFSEATAVRAATSEFRALTDPLGHWLDKHLVSDPS